MNSQPIENKSEVARLMATIQAEYESSTRAIKAFSQGVSKHEFITKRTEMIANIVIDMGKQYGDEIVMQAIISLPGDSGSAKNNGTSVS